MVAYLSINIQQEAEKKGPFAASMNPLPHAAYLTFLMLPSAGSKGNFMYMQLGDSDLPSKTGEDAVKGFKVARLASPTITTPDSELCMSFWYYVFNEHAGKLLIKLWRKEEEDVEEARVLKTVSGHQSRQWMERRVLLPNSTEPFKVGSPEEAVVWKSLL